MIITKSYTNVLCVKIQIYLSIYDLEIMDNCNNKQY